MICKTASLWIFISRIICCASSGLFAFGVVGCIIHCTLCKRNTSTTHKKKSATKMLHRTVTVPKFNEGWLIDSFCYPIIILLYLYVDFNMLISTYVLFYFMVLVYYNKIYHICYNWTNHSRGRKLFSQKLLLIINMNNNR